MAASRSWLLALAACILLGSTEMTMAGDLAPITLGAEPLKSVAATLDLQAEEGTLAANGRPGIVTLAKVALGTPEVAWAEPTDETKRLLPPRQGMTWRFYSVVFPFSLVPPPEDSIYEEMKLSVAIGNASVEAIQLVPERSDETTGLPPDKIKLALGLRLPQIAEGSVEYRTTVAVPSVRRVTGFGIGTPQFWWNFQGKKNGVDPGVHRLAAILKMPDTVSRITGEISCEVVIRRTSFFPGDPERLSAASKPWSFSLAADMK